MAIVGSYELLPMNSFHVLPGQVGLIIGAPIATTGLTVRDTEKLASRVRQVIAELYASHLERAPAASESSRVVKTQEELRS